MNHKKELLRSLWVARVLGFLSFPTMVSAVAAGILAISCLHVV